MLFFTKKHYLCCLKKSSPGRPKDLMAAINRREANE